MSATVITHVTAAGCAVADFDLEIRRGARFTTACGRELIARKRTTAWNLNHADGHEAVTCPQCRHALGLPVADE